MDERMALNRAKWDERVPIHEASDFYDVDGFRTGRITVQPFELAELGPLASKRICHLQCHFGMDSLSLARLGAEVVGLDFSQPAVDAASRLANDVGLSDQARFVKASVYDARESLDGYFDIVYVSWGTLIWLPDISEWARVVDSLLQPGGFLYLADCHPYAGALHPSADRPDLLQQSDPYGDSTEQEWDEPGTYAQPDAATVNTRDFQWCHGLGQIVTAVAEAGLRLDWLHERPVLVWPQWPTMERGEDGLWRQPGSTLPLSFSLRATKSEP